MWISSILTHKLWFLLGCRNRKWWRREDLPCQELLWEKGISTSFLVCRRTALTSTSREDKIGSYPRKIILFELVGGLSWLTWVNEVLLYIITFCKTIYNIWYTIHLYNFIQFSFDGKTCAQQEKLQTLCSWTAASKLISIRILSLLFPLFSFQKVTTQL